MGKPPDGARSGNEPLEKQVQQALEECRVVMPGVQALFGFQLVVVFNQRFTDALGDVEQRLHLVALAFVTLAVGLVMAPVAYHRQVEPESISERLVRIITGLLGAGMFTLMCGIALDLFVVATAVLHERVPALAIGGAALVVLATLWIVLPYVGRVARRRHRGSSRQARAAAE